MTSGATDYENCLCCGKQLPPDRYANRMFCDKRCTNRHWKLVRAGKATRAPAVDAATRLAEMTPEQRGWVAGIIEGEGSITVHSFEKIGNVYTYPLVKVAMTDEDVIRRLHEWTGLGRVSGPFSPPSRGSNKPHWDWNVNRIAHVEALFSMLWPLLGGRRREQVVRVRERISERTLKRGS